MNQQEPSDWRLLISEQDRLTIIKHIFGKLQVFAPDLPDDRLQVRTRHFEDQAFRSAANRQEYLTKIAHGLSKIEVASNRRSSLTLYQLQQILQLQQEQQLHHQLEDLDTNDVSTQDRLIFIQFIFIKLKEFAPDLPDVRLQERARHFGDQAFCSAANRSQYLSKIAHGLSKIELASDRSSTVKLQQQYEQVRQQLEELCSNDISAQDRLTFTKHIVKKLRNFTPDFSESQLHQNAHDLEDQAFRSAVGRSDYLIQIAHGLSKTEIAANRSSTLDLQQQNQPPRQQLEVRYEITFQRLRRHVSELVMTDVNGKLHIPIYMEINRYLNL